MTIQLHFLVCYNKSEYRLRNSIYQLNNCTNISLCKRKKILNLWASIVIYFTFTGTLKIVLWISLLWRVGYLVESVIYWLAHWSSYSWNESLDNFTKFSFSVFSSVRTWHCQTFWNKMLVVTFSHNSDFMFRR